MTDMSTRDDPSNYIHSKRKHSGELACLCMYVVSQSHIFRFIHMHLFETSFSNGDFQGVQMYTSAGFSAVLELQGLFSQNSYFMITINNLDKLLNL